MKWFLWNYMSLIVNVLHMLLMMSLSMSTGLPDIKQTFIWTFLYQQSHSSRTNPLVLFMLSYLVCCDCRIRVDYSIRSYACPLCWVFLAKLGLIPSTWNSPSPSSPLKVLEPLILIPWLTATITPFLLTELSYFPLCNIVVKALPYNPLLGLLHQMVWGLIGTSYWGYPLDMLVGPAPSTTPYHTHVF